MANRLWRKMLSKSDIHRHSWLEYEILLCTALRLSVFKKYWCKFILYTFFISLQGYFCGGINIVCKICMWCFFGICALAIEWGELYIKVYQPFLLIKPNFFLSMFLFRFFTHSRGRFLHEPQTEQWLTQEKQV